jgi:hypothetical protein
LNPVDFLIWHTNRFENRSSGVLGQLSWCAWEKVSVCEINVAGADTTGLEQSALPAVVAGDTFISWNDFLSEFSGIECETLLDG